jgi:hypothetical protein
MRFSTIIRKPSAFLPLVLSLAALALVVGHVAVYGIVRGGDEGTAAHLFQLLLAAEVPVMAVFAAKWLSRAPRQALLVLALQAAAVLLALAPVFVLEL